MQFEPDSLQVSSSLYVLVEMSILNVRFSKVFHGSVLVRFHILGSIPPH